MPAVLRRRTPADNYGDPSDDYTGTGPLATDPPSPNYNLNPVTSNPVATQPYMPPTPPTANAGPVERAPMQYPDLKPIQQTPQVGPNGTEVGRNYNAMPGWDTTKLNDTSYGSPKYQFGRWIQNTGSGATTDSLRRFVNENPNWEMNGADQLRIKGAPNWEDVIKGVGDPNAAWNWLDVPSAMGATGATGAAGARVNSGTAVGSNSGAGVIDANGNYSGYGANSGDNFGNDPFSLAITGKLKELIDNNGHVNSNSEALNLENVRQAADRARKAEYQGAMSQLASRGLLPENTPGGQGGLALDALGRIERNDIAPLFSAGMRDYLVHDNDLASNRLMGALSQGTQRQDVLSNIALQTLSQNSQFNQFLAQFGLNRDKTLADLASGQNSQLVNLLLQYLGGAGTAANGYV